MIGYPVYANEKRARQTKRDRLTELLGNSNLDLNAVSMGLIPLELAEFDSNLIMQVANKIKTGEVN